MCIRDSTTIVSFDPNYRKEMMAEKEFVKMCTPFFERSNLFLPSEGEAELFLGEGDERESCRTCSERGKIIALKCGSKGSYAFEEGRTYYVRPYEVEEIDSTGAGDIFGGVFLHSLMRGRDEMCIRDSCLSDTVFFAVTFSQKFLPCHSEGTLLVKFYKKEIGFTLLCISNRK